MNKLWPGVFLTSLVWLFLLPLYEPPNRAGWLLLAAGVCLNALAFRGREAARALPRWPFALAGVAAATLFAAAFAWPLNLGAFVLLAAFACALAARRLPRLRAASWGLALGGAVLVAQALAWRPYAHVAARLHRVPALDTLYGWVLNALGGTAEAGPGGIFVQTPTGVHQLYTTFEALGLYPLLNVLIGGAVVLLWAGRARRLLPRLLLLLAAYGAARYAVLLFVFADFQTSDIFWQRAWLLASLAPLPLFLWRWLPLAPAPDASPEAAPRPAPPRAVWAAAALALAACAFTGALLFQDPGARKRGRVLFDESHSNWEWMDRAYDTEWYGERSGYNYYSLGRYLNHYYEVSIGKEPLTPELLSRFDVLVLKTPTSPYSPQEISAVVDFVERGGGLWLIGDHTNVFGMGTYLNPVASAFGFAFKFDATYDLPTGNLTFYEPGRARHPVVGHVPYYLFATSCSLDAPLLSQSVILGSGVKGLQADYSQKSFFPKDAHTSSEMEYGLLVQSAARSYGDGRVLLYTDSTCFSNFYMFMTGKPELALGSIEWLNRRGRYGFVRLLLAALGAAGAALAVVLRRKTGAWPQPAAAALAVLFGVSGAVWAAGAYNGRAYPRPRPHTDYPRVVFDGSHSKYFLPLKELRPLKTEEAGPDLHTFFVWTQRLGLYPEVREDFAESLSDGDAVVVVNPTRDFTDEEVAAFVRYVEGGGKALVLDDPRNKLHSTAHQLLRPFGLRVEYQPIAAGVIEDAEGAGLWEGRHFGRVTGGDPYLYVRPVAPGRQGPAATQQASAAGAAAVGDGAVQPPPRLPLLSVARRGQGVLAVMANSSAFATETMGTTSTVPDEPRRRLYELEYRLFRDLLKVTAEAEPKLLSGRTP